MFVIQVISDGDVCGVPTIVSSFVTADQQDGRSTRIERVERAQWVSAMLGSEFSHVSVLGSVDATAVREPE